MSFIVALQDLAQYYDDKPFGEDAPHDGLGPQGGARQKLPAVR